MLTRHLLGDSCDLEDEAGGACFCWGKSPMGSLPHRWMGGVFGIPEVFLRVRVWVHVIQMHV